MNLFKFRDTYRPVSWLTSVELIFGKDTINDEVTISSTLRVRFKDGNGWNVTKNLQEDEIEGHRKKFNALIDNITLYDNHLIDLGEFL